MLGLAFALRPRFLALALALPPKALALALQLMASLASLVELLFTTACCVGNNLITKGEVTSFLIRGCVL